MTRPVVAVIDYGIGNSHSAQKALEVCGADARLTADPELIAAADGVVLPGVGAFGACMAALRNGGLEQPALDAVASGRPFLGICVGMQMLFTRSEENPDATGLGIIPGTVRKIPTEPGVGPKIPQMQWNLSSSCCLAIRCLLISGPTRGCTSCIPYTAFLTTLPWLPRRSNTAPR